jgi:alpha-glucosidase (family GH31 glycosyl hydrolase)
MQVGSLYPFARNHNENESIPQEPYKLGETLLETSRLSLYQRYSLLKQMYSTLLELNGTGSFYRPLVFEFYHDPQAFLNKFMETEFLIGDYLLGTPIVEKGSKEREVYFPQGPEKEVWYELTLDTNSGVTVGPSCRSFKGQTTHKIENPLPSAPPIFLRGGRLILTNAPATRVSRLSNNYTIIAALSNS